MMTGALIKIAEDHALLTGQNAEEYITAVEWMRKTLNKWQHARIASQQALSPQLSEWQVESSGLQQFSSSKKRAMTECETAEIIDREKSWWCCRDQIQTQADQKK